MVNFLLVDMIFPKRDAGDNAKGKQFVFIELCAGSAVLSAAAQKHGYRVMSVDCKRNRHKPRCKIVSWDLSEDHAWDVLRYIVQTCDVAAVHFAPPCGTCSKARGIPMADGSPGPQPVRSDEHLLGIPGISELDQVKVTAANRLYERMGQFIEWLHERGICMGCREPDQQFSLGVTVFFFCCETRPLCALSCLCVWRKSPKENVVSQQQTEHHDDAVVLSRCSTA